MNKKEKTFEFTVRWEIQIDAATKKEAAIKAMEIMRDRASTATVMSVAKFNDTADKFEDFDLSGDKSEKIRYIKEVLGEWGSTSSGELELEHSPCLNMGGGKVRELVERFYFDNVETVIYDGMIELEYNNYFYEELPDNIIDEIYEIMEDYEADMLKTEKRCSIF